MKFTIRDLVWATLSVAIVVWFMMQQRDMRREMEQVRLEAAQAKAETARATKKAEEIAIRALMLQNVQNTGNDRATQSFLQRNHIRLSTPKASSK